MSETTVAVLCVSALVAGAWLGAFASQRSLVSLAGRGEKFPLEGRWYYLVPEGDLVGDLYAENEAYRRILAKAVRAVGDSEVTMGDLDDLVSKADMAGDEAWAYRTVGDQCMVVVDPGDDIVADRNDECYYGDVYGFIAAANPSVVGRLAAEMREIRRALSDISPVNG